MLTITITAVTTDHDDMYLLHHDATDDVIKVPLNIPLDEAINKLIDAIEEN